MTLLDCYIPVFYKVLLIIQQREEHTPLLQEAVMASLSQAQHNARLQGYDIQDIEEAYFAVLVWVDEVILSAGGEWLRHWRLASLQQMHYDSALGGHTFFERLNTLPTSREQVRLVYLYCLLCGFRGCFDNTDDLELNHIIQHQVDSLPDNIRQYLSEQHTSLMLSPHWRSGNSRRKRWKLFLCGLGVVLFLYCIASIWFIKLGY